MKIRFVQGSEWSSQLIVLQEKTAMPFTPSHVEAVTPDGFYLGSMYHGGVEERRPGYDEGLVTHQLIINLPATPDQDASFYTYLRAHIGEPYDWKAIVGFLLPEHFHDKEHTICSALIAMALRSSLWFPYPLAAPAHLIDPRDLLLLISGRMQIPM